MDDGEHETATTRSAYSVRWMTGWAFGLSWLAASCSTGDGSEPQDPSGFNLTMGEAEDTDGDPGSSGDTLDPPDPADASDSSSLPNFDLGAPDAGSSEPGSGCTKVDFLFVIDNSRSMQGKQAAIAETFEPFMLAIEDELETSDVHVMVVDTDATTLCTPENCADPGDNGPVLEHCIEAAGADGGYACQTELFDACDGTLGAGIVHPAGNYASNQPCPVTGNKRYLDETDDLVGAFGCMARVGTAGNKRERPMDAMLAALDPGNGCNAGFLRPDAVLVVTFISDDQCWEDAGTPAEWKAELVDLKGEGAVVVLGLIPNTTTCQHDADACDGPEDVIDGQHWLQFVESWGGDHGLSGSVCETEFFPELFTSAVSIISTTCEEYEPPG
jgi:hypothetical protein